MARKPNTNVNGQSFSEETKLAVWEKGKVVAGYDPAKTRKDICGAWMYWVKYGDTAIYGYGWEIDHIIPVSKGGTDELNNLQPLQWQNNRQKGNEYPAGKFCVIPSYKEKRLNKPAFGTMSV